MADGLRDPAAWNWAMVQSVGGGFVVSEDRLTFFVGSNSNTSGYTGTASLRRLKSFLPHPHVLVAGYSPGLSRQHMH